MALQQPMTLSAELVDPRERAAVGDWSEAIEVPGLEQLAEAALASTDRAVGPPELENLRRAEELVAPHVPHNRDVARLECAGNDRANAIVVDRGTVVPVRVGVATRHEHVARGHLVPPPR